MNIHRDQVWEICKIVAPRFAFKPLLVSAVMAQEAEKDKKDPALYLADYARLEQGFYRRYVVGMDFATTTEVLLAASYGIPQMMGESLLELCFFQRDFDAQNEAYRATYGTWKHPNHFRDCLDRWCITPTKQVETACEWLDKKRKAVGPDTRRILLAWNGGSNKQYDDEVLAKQDALAKIYGGAP